MKLSVFVKPIYAVLILECRKMEAAGSPEIKTITEFRIQTEQLSSS